MNVTDEGLALIRRAEGLRLRSYRDAVGVWTIGYGHTSAAGEPIVKPDQDITEADANAILRRDVEKFAAGVRKAVLREINDQQFSALVSFAYNVGLGAFKSSSVLKAVNAEEFGAVPQRLQLWVKAGGRTLPGLVKRRAAEAALFLKRGGDDTVQGPVEPTRGKPAMKSTTVWAAALATLVVTLNELARLLGYGVIGLAVAGAVALAAWWIIRERLNKSNEQGV